MSLHEDPGTEGEVMETRTASSMLALREPDIKPVLVMSPGEALARLNELKQFVAEVMIDGEDYGKVDWGSPKEKERERYILYQPGAQKLLEVYGYYADPVIDKENESFGQIGPDGDGQSRWTELPFFYYRVRTQVVNRRTGNVVGASYGSANSREANYLWRKSERSCPNCGLPNIRKSKQGVEEWYCWKKTNGCGHTFAIDDPRITGQVAGRVLNEDVADLANTILKMAVKRSVVAASIAVTRSAMLFTQDLEDVAIVERNGAAASGAAAETPGVGDGTAAAREAPSVAPKPAKTVRAAAGGGEVPRTAHNEARSRSSSTAASASPPSDVGAEMSGPPTPEETNALWALIKKQGLRKKLVSGKWLVEFPVAVSKALGMPPGHVVVGEMTAFQVMRVRETMEAIAFQEPTEVKMVEEPKGAVVFEREPGDEAQFVDDGGARRL